MVWRVRDAQLGRLTGRAAISATAVFALVLVTSCSALSGSSSSSSSSTGSNSQGLEKATITVGGLASSSSAALYIAEDKGYFKQQGLNVKIVTTTNGTQALQQLQGGAADIVLANDVTGIQAQHKGTAIKLVFDGPTAAPNTYVISALPNSGIKTLTDLRNKTVGVSSLNDAVVATLKDDLVAVNVDPSQVKFVVVPYASSETALKTKIVDATTTSEPFTTEASETLGSSAVVDVFPANSEASNISIAGFFANTKFVQNDPKTLAAFQNAMIKGATDAANRQIVEASLHKHLPKLSQQVLDVMAIPGFPADLDPNRLQRVADLMQKAGYLKAHYDVRQILAPFPTSP
jgi:NitT/TauT family transport system substrate-binding protein